MRIEKIMDKNILPSENRRFVDLFAQSTKNLLFPCM